MATDISVLIRKRGTFKQKLTILENHLESFQSSGFKAEKRIHTELQLRMNNNESLFDDFNNVQSNIEEQCSDADLQAHYAERLSFESRYFATFSLLKELLNAKPAFNSRSNSPTPSVASNNSEIPVTNRDAITSPPLLHNNLNPQFQESQLQAVKLPTIKLPVFRGTYDSWLEFKDTFNSLINFNSTINSVQKFHYLRASLEGSATRIIQSLEFSANNYQNAWDLLCQRYDNRRLLVHNHLKALFSLDAIIKESPIQIRQLVDNVSKHLRALNTLSLPTDHWDTLVIFLITSKLDKTTLRECEEYKIKSELPNLDEMFQFLRSKADLLETLLINAKEPGQHRTSNKHVSLNLATVQCYNCQGSHAIYKCKEFLKLDIQKRIDKVKELKLCMNCLKTGHQYNDCKLGSCRTCNKKHNSLLHLQHIISNQSQGQVSSLVNNNASHCFSQVLLSTATIRIQDSSGNFHTCKCLLDSGATSNLITGKLCTQLSLPTKDTHASIVGVNHTISNVNKVCSVTIFSNHTKFTSSIQCFVLNRITDNLPNQALDSSMLNIPDNVQLADPDFHIPGEIEILIGASIFWDIIIDGKIKLGKRLPVLQNTLLGWIISGPFQQVSSKVYANFVTSNEDDQLKKFWEIQECPKSIPFSADEQQCENLFQSTMQRSDQGRFVVKFPFKQSPKLLGNTHASATKRFLSLERRLETNPYLKSHYHNFIQEYQDLGHMSKVDHDTPCEPVAYYLPHHGVFKETSSTTKLRVVFDGSHKSDSGVSLNDIQFIGPKVQNDIFSILLRFRQHKYVVTADVQKMYRQILMHPDHRVFQRILWRNHSNDALSSYELNTVTYGTASAPYLAIRCLNQLAQENMQEFPVSSQTILRDFYVDDMLTGENDIDKLSEICREISLILQSGGFELHKWISNEPQIFQGLCNSSTSNGILDLDKSQSCKTLGIQWASHCDSLTFKIAQPPSLSVITKRHMLSNISQIYDPLGLLSPVTILAKLMIQELWLCNISWDDQVPPEISIKWLQYRTQLSVLNSLNLPRHVICSNAVAVELHGFCDASQAAFGACVYVRSVSSNGECQVRLLCAKTKVAPLKTLSIPRLELCSALLLAQLVQQVLQSLTISLSCYFWSDSQIVLAWLNNSPHSLNVFVANRVCQIQEWTDINNWYHIRSKLNPADLASRGISPDKLLATEIWWTGPPWLSYHQSLWPITQPDKLLSIELPELKKQCHVQKISEDSDIILFSRFSNFQKLQRTMAYCLRFISNCKVPKVQRQYNQLSIQEITTATKSLIKLVQYTNFTLEIKLIKSESSSQKLRSLSKLSPFVDEHGFLRVGGRLQSSTFQFDVKHPYLLPAKHILTKLIFAYEHIRLLHAGPRLLLASIRQLYWPINGRNLAKITVYNCVTCSRFNPKTIQPTMGSLPIQRVSQSFPFQFCGVDYAGPFQIKDRKTRGAKFSKCYISLFVCFTIKAIHLELVSDLTTDSFLAAFRRFCARRGKPTQVFSDNGTNFVGARNELKELASFISSNGETLTHFASKDNVSWQFIPPHSPHFGGLWEAGVKSVKFHLRRILLNSVLTFEEFTTLLTQIEATLNSRPLIPLSSDPNDLNPLSPSHFLIGRTFTSLPDPDLQHINMNKLSRYQMLQQMYQHFWRRWSVEYISELQEKIKWKSSHQTLPIGSLVIIKEDHLPPNKWLLGRVIQLHPGNDGISRVATIKTSKGAIKRTVTKLCPLPRQESEIEH